MTNLTQRSDVGILEIILRFRVSLCGNMEESISICVSSWNSCIEIRSSVLSAQIRSNSDCCCQTWVTLHVNQGERNRSGFQEQTRLHSGGRVWMWLLKQGNLSLSADIALLIRFVTISCIFRSWLTSASFLPHCYPWDTVHLYMNGKIARVSWEVSHQHCFWSCNVLCSPGLVLSF